MIEATDIQVDDGVACVRLREGIFDLGTDLDARNNLFQALDEFEQSDEILVVLLINSEGAFSKQEHIRFRDRVASQQAKGRRSEAEMLAGRQDNAFKMMHSLVARYSKPVISCLSGEIASPFLGLSLSSDLRLVSPNTQLRFSHVDLDVPPMGGLGFLLPRFIGPGRASEYLITGGSIDAEHALQLGLANAILGEDSFESHCVQWARERLESGICRIPAMRKLLSYQFAELEEYLVQESKIRFQSLHLLG